MSFRAQNEKIGPSRLLLDGYPLGLGAVGISTYTREIIESLGKSPLAKQVSIVVPTWMEEAPSLKDSGLDVKKLSLPKRLPGLLRNFLWMEKVGLFSRMYSNSVFHCPSLFSATVYSPATFVTCHDLIPLEFPQYLGKRYFRAAQFKRNLSFFERCRGLITVSDYSKLQIMRHCEVSADRIHVVPNMLSARFNPTKASQDAARVREKYGLPERFWLYIGGYDIRKNVEFLLEAYAKILPTKGDPKLVLAGKVPQAVHETLCNVPRAMIENDLGPASVLLPGYIATEDLPGLYGAAELLIFPSLAEGFGLTPLEALMSGCPVLCSDNTALKEVVTDPKMRFTTERTDQLVQFLRVARSTPFQRPLSFDRGRFLPESILPKYIRALGVGAQST